MATITSHDTKIPTTTPGSAETGTCVLPPFAGSDNLYRQYFERTSDAILIIRGETFVDCNQAVVDMLRYETREQLLQTHPSELSPDVQPDGQLSFDKANEMMSIALRDGSHRFEWDHKRADGDVFPVEVLLTAIPCDDGVMLHTVWRDITERKRLQSEINHAQKMEAVGKLVGGIAHDFNNLLVAILGNAELMKIELNQGKDDSFQEYIDEISKAGDRAADLVGQLLAYSRKQVLRSRVIDLNEIPRRVAPMLRHIIGEDIVVETLSFPEPVPVKADPGQLEQVLMNLASNARDAMPDGGRISIEIFSADMDEWQSHRGRRFPAGRYAGLRVLDTGQGIDDVILDQIFEPFFTTKSTGTGLGLSTVTGIINQSGGGIQLATRKGAGTHFTIYLPISTEAVRKEGKTAIESVSIDGAGQVVLLVEDEPSVARLAEQVLSRQGYEVHKAINGQEALAMVENGNCKFDLLLTDVIMPKMGGPELARILAETDKDLRVLYISGYTNEALSSRGILDEGVQLINKPFTVDQLISAVGQVMSV
jgi:PAS domain S-box-containing protein